MIYVYNREKEDYSMLDSNYPIYRGVSILGNPYTHLPVKGTKAMFQCKTREEAIEKYDKYFDIMYGKGISRIGELIDLAVDTNVISKAGAWFSYGETRLGQGRDKVKILLEENHELAKEIEEKVEE